ncbi:WD40 repeat-like protein [Cylindrobasidium torrendii FP15055 ss-10]|uniref:WD40 repeat-like protein n=1 Tax=Cylindrobasidium torrendii FP15055 ss-10 TaxID=1314674 RepID=A0A0D7BT12_9AGAR|nr:WD40 repeat-like protein [Cylindrobasidium torrendii FP15055 ss-10]
MRPQDQSMEDDEYAAEEENKTINEEYKTWKKNAPYLYDIVVTHALEWPTLTCQWFPDKESPSDKPYTVHRLLLGTHTSGQSTDFLQIATVSIPKRAGPGSDKLDRTDYDDDRGELGGHSIPPAPRVKVIQRINHPGEVNRARYMPQNPDLIATKTVGGEVLVFDRTKHANEPEKNGTIKADIRLTGQNGEGFGLAWNSLQEGQVLSASEDMTVCLWDVQSYTKGDNTLQPKTTFRAHTSVVGDVDWNHHDQNIFASVGDDKTLFIWDTRQPNPAQTFSNAHDREILAVSFNPSNQNLLVTGSSDKTVILHDLRCLGQKKHTFEGHTDEVLSLQWSPHNETIFASASSDRRINVWDLSAVGNEQTPDDAEDGPPELLFVHGGHTSRPTDFCWAPNEDDQWTVVSAAEDNVVQVWQPTMRIWAGDEVKIDPRELEDSMMEDIQEEKLNVAGSSVSGDD